MIARATRLGRAVTAVLLAGACTVAANAATATHLTTAGWQALTTVNAMSEATVAACRQVGAGSSDEQVHGVVGICTDEAEGADWLSRILLQCGASSPERRCGDDVAGIDGDLSAIAEWSQWFTTQLGPGGCRSFFASLAAKFAAEARAGAPLAADLRAGDSPTKLKSAWQTWANQLRADDQDVQSQTGTLQLDLSACKPAP